MQISLQKEPVLQHLSLLGSPLPYSSSSANSVIVRNYARNISKTVFMGWHCNYSHYKHLEFCEHVMVGGSDPSVVGIIGNGS